MQALSSNPTNIGYWNDKKLSYTWHATERAKERELPILEVLPENAKLSDVDKLPNGDLSTVIFKVGEGEQGFLIVVDVQGVVITLFRNTKKEFAEYRRKKERRRYYEAKNCVFSAQITA